MDDDETIDIIKKMKRFNQRVVGNPQMARRFLQKAGIIDAEGHLTENYREPKKHIEVEHQVIRQDGKPAFAVVPYEQFLKLLDRADANAKKPTIPHEVVKAHIERGVSLAKAWREHLRLTQEGLAKRAGMSQAALAKLENSTTLQNHEALGRLAAAMGLQVEQLVSTMDTNPPPMDESRGG